MSNRRSIQGSSEKAFYEVFQQLCVRHSPWTIWCDFIKLFACSLSNALEPDMARREDREKMYLSTASGYPADELKQFVELASITILALDQNPQQDFLGNLYMSMDFGSSWHGQFFTPWHIANCMAKMTISDCESELQDKGFVHCCAMSWMYPPQQPVLRFQRSWRHYLWKSKGKSCAFSM